MICSEMFYHYVLAQLVILQSILNSENLNGSVCVLYGPYAMSELLFSLDSSIYPLFQQVNERKTLTSRVTGGCKIKMNKISAVDKAGK